MRQSQHGQSIFITATDTDAGKTWVTASAIRSLRARGINARALKPVVCGQDSNGCYADIEALLAAQGLSDRDAISRYRFALPAAPAQAAAAEGNNIDPDELLAWCNEKTTTGITLIEGVGGLMVPITERWLVCDWIAAMPDAEVWLVVGCRLGAINQALLTLDKLTAIGRPPARILFNATTSEQNAWLEPSRRAVEPFLPSACLIDSIEHGHAVEIHP